MATLTPSGYESLPRSPVDPGLLVAPGDESGFLNSRLSDDDSPFVLGSLAAQRQASLPPRLSAPNHLGTLALTNETDGSGETAAVLDPSVAALQGLSAAAIFGGMSLEVEAGRSGQSATPPIFERQASAPATERAPQPHAAPDGGAIRDVFDQAVRYTGPASWELRPVRAPAHPLTLRPPAGVPRRWSELYPRRTMTDRLAERWDHLVGRVRHTAAVGRAHAETYAARVANEATTYAAQTLQSLQHIETRWEQSAGERTGLRADIGDAWRAISSPRRELWAQNVWANIGDLAIAATDLAALHIGHGLAVARRWIRLGGAVAHTAIPIPVRTHVTEAMRPLIATIRDQSDRIAAMRMPIVWEDEQPVDARTPLETRPYGLELAYAMKAVSRARYAVGNPPEDATRRDRYARAYQLQLAERWLERLRRRDFRFDRTPSLRSRLRGARTRAVAHITGQTVIAALRLTGDYQTIEGIARTAQHFLTKIQASRWFAAIRNQWVHERAWQPGATRRHIARVVARNQAEQLWWAARRGVHNWVEGVALAFADLLDDGRPNVALAYTSAQAGMTQQRAQFVHPQSRIVVAATMIPPTVREAPISSLPQLDFRTGLARTFYEFEGGNFTHIATAKQRQLADTLIRECFCMVDMQQVIGRHLHAVLDRTGIKPEVWLAEALAAAQINGSSDQWELAQVLAATLPKLLAPAPEVPPPVHAMVAWVVDSVADMPGDKGIQLLGIIDRHDDAALAHARKLLDEFGLHELVLTRYRAAYAAVQRQLSMGQKQLVRLEDITLAVLLEYLYAGGPEHPSAFVHAFGTALRKHASHAAGVSYA